MKRINSIALALCLLLSFAAGCKGADLEKTAELPDPKKARIAVQFHDMKSAAMIPSGLSNKTPVAISNITATDERRQSAVFSPDYFQNPQVLLARKLTLPKGGIEAQSAEQTAPDYLTGKRVGGITGTRSETYCLEYYQNAQYASFPTLSDEMLALKSGVIDYAVCGFLDVVNFKRSDPSYGIAQPDLEAVNCYIAVAKDEVELLHQINALLDRYEADGTLALLNDHWIRPDGSDYVIEEIPKITGGEPIRVSFCSGFEPFCYVKDGAYVGYDIELMRRLAYDLGRPVEFLDMQFTGILAALESGKADTAVCSLVRTPERAEIVNFTRPYYARTLVLAYYQADAAEDKSFPATLINSFEKNFLVENRWRLIVSGVGVTLLLSVCSGIMGILIGFAFCLMRMGRNKALRNTISALTRVLQGTPMVVLLMILYYVVFNKTGLDGVSVAIIAFGLNFGANVSEIMRSGILAVDDGQREAAAAIGFSPAQTFYKIVFPQAARHFLPVLRGEYISLVKMTSVVGYVAVQDLTKMGDIVRSRTYEAFFPLIVTAFIYFMLSLGLSSLLKLVEVRIDPKRRPRTLKGVDLQ